MAESKLKYPGELYQPQWKLLKENFTEAEMTREYSRLRDIAQKRLGRMGESEFARSFTYELNVGKFPVLSTYTTKGKITAKSDFAYTFAKLARFVDNPLSLKRPQAQAKREQLERLHDSGYDFVTESNYWDFVHFMDDFKSDKRLSKMYDSDRVANAYSAANKARVDPNKLLEEFEFFQKKTNQEYLKQWRRQNPKADTSTMSADELRQTIEDFKIAKAKEKGMKKYGKTSRGSSGR